MEVTIFSITLISSLGIGKWAILHTLFICASLNPLKEVQFIIIPLYRWGNLRLIEVKTLAHSYPDNKWWSWNFNQDLLDSKVWGVFHRANCLLALALNGVCKWVTAQISMNAPEIYHSPSLTPTPPPHSVPTGNRLCFGIWNSPQQ